MNWSGEIIHIKLPRRLLSQEQKDLETSSSLFIFFECVGEGYVHIFTYDFIFPLNFQSLDRSQELLEGPPLLEHWSGCHLSYSCFSGTSYKQLLHLYLRSCLGEVVTLCLTLSKVGETTVT